MHRARRLIRHSTPATCTSTAPVPDRCRRRRRSEASSRAATAGRAAASASKSSSRSRTSTSTSDQPAGSVLAVASDEGRPNRTLLLRKVHVDELEIVPRPAEDDWRESLQRRFGGSAGSAVNQGRPLPRAPATLWKIPSSFAAMCGAACVPIPQASRRHIASERIDLVDFLVTHRGRVGVMPRSTADHTTAAVQAVPTSSHD